MVSMAYDKAKWHSDGNFPEDLPQENGGTHIGMFLAWAILHGMASDELRADAASDLNAVRKRRMTGRTFLFRHLDGVLSEDDLNGHGNAFARHYYTKYLRDLSRLAEKGLPTLYHLPNNWANYDTIAKVIDQRYAQWRANKR